MKTIVYSIYDGGDEPLYFATLAEAKATARQWADTEGREIEVERNVTVDMPIRELAVILLSGIGWCDWASIAYVAKPRKGRAG